MDTSSLLDFKNRRFRVVLRLTLVVAVLFYVMYRIIYKPTLLDSPIWSGYEVAGNEYFPTFSVMNPNKKKLFVSITKNAINYGGGEKERLFFTNNPQIKSLKEEGDLWWILYQNDDSYAVVVYQLTRNKIVQVYL